MLLHLEVKFIVFTKILQQINLINNLSKDNINIS